MSISSLKLTLFVLIVLVLLSYCSSYLCHKVSPHTSSISTSRTKVTTTLSYKKSSSDNNNSDNNDGDNTHKKSMFDGLLRFISGVTRARIENKYDIPLPSIGDRYHLRLVRSERSGSKRHATTRIVRFLPDISFETAQSIVEKSYEEGKALVRVFQSKAQALDIANMFRIAVPPLNVEIYDDKTDEILL